MSNIRPIFIHRQSGEGMKDRFDTLQMVNGSIAACCTIAHQLGYQPLAIDEAFPGTAHMNHRVREAIETSLRAGEMPVIFCSVLSYNAEGSLTLLRELKAEYGPRIRVGVGGQLIRIAPEAYLRKEWLDHIGIGDAEVTLPRLLAGERYASGYQFDDNELLQLEKPDQDNSTKNYVPLSYQWYDSLEERLRAMSRLPPLGPLQHARQLVIESVRGCAWAHRFDVCQFCSLEGIGKKPHFKPLAQHFQLQQELVETYRLNWLFDVSNQWLPCFGTEAVSWLEQYLTARQTHGGPDIHIYTYLTSNSLNRQTAPLLREAGIRMAYVGIDGWNDQTWKAHGKSRNVLPALEAAKRAGIYLRGSVVIGSGLDGTSLAELPTFVHRLINEYGDNLLTLGVFMEIILQGSPIWHQFEQEAQSRNLLEAVKLYDKMATLGYLSWEDEVALTRCYIDSTQAVSSGEAESIRDEVVKIVEKSGKTIPTTIEDGGDYARSTS